MYAYCNNNPVMGTDESGRGWLGAIIGGVCGAFVGATYGALNALITGDDILTTVIESAIIGGTTGAIAGSVAEDIATGGITSIGTATLLVSLSSLGIGVVTDVTTQIITNSMNDEADTDIDWGRAIQTGVEASCAATLSLVLPWGGLLENVVLTTMYSATVSTMQFGVHAIQEAFERQKEALEKPNEEPIPIY